MRPSFNSEFQKFLDSIRSNSDFGDGYYSQHRDRFKEVFDLIPAGSEFRNIIEIGATSFFQSILCPAFGYSRVVGTIFSENALEKNYIREYHLNGFVTRSQIVSVNVEDGFLPFAEDWADAIICSEVIEHLDIDPMAMLIELNRNLRIGGHLILTTPNACSSANVWKILNGYRPHFFMQYEKSRSPYRHNFEWDTHGLNLALKSAGFEVKQLYTKDVFENPNKLALQVLAQNVFPIEDRGDCLFVVAKKIGSPTCRHPESLYV
jgi:SAM-dependent methyltransferase